MHRPCPPEHSVGDPYLNTDSSWSCCLSFKAAARLVSNILVSIFVKNASTNDAPTVNEPSSKCSYCDTVTDMSEVQLEAGESVAWLLVVRLQQSFCSECTAICYSATGLDSRVHRQFVIAFRQRDRDANTAVNYHHHRCGGVILSWCVAEVGW